MDSVRAEWRLNSARRLAHYVDKSWLVGTCGLRSLRAAPVGIDSPGSSIVRPLTMTEVLTQTETPHRGRSRFRLPVCTMAIGILTLLLAGAGGIMGIGQSIGSRALFLQVTSTIVGAIGAIFVTLSLVSLKPKGNWSKFILSGDHACFVYPTGRTVEIRWSNPPFLLGIFDLRSRPTELGQPAIFVHMEFPSTHLGVCSAEDAMKLESLARHSRVEVVKDRIKDSWRGMVWDVPVTYLAPRN